MESIEIAMALPVCYIEVMNTWAAMGPCKGIEKVHCTEDSVVWRFITSRLTLSRVLTFLPSG